MATATLPPTAGSPRRRFALTGRTVRLDPRSQAVRSDLADVRLAEFVFAPHYAAPLVQRTACATALRAARDARSERLADLPPGASFEVLEIAGDSAWGVAPGAALVGYVDRAALVDPA